MENVELYNCTFAQINESSTAVKIREIRGNVLRKKQQQQQQKQNKKTKTKKATHDKILAHSTDQKTTLPILAFVTSSELHFKIILDTLTFFA